MRRHVATRKVSLSRRGVFALIAASAALLSSGFGSASSAQELTIPEPTFSPQSTSPAPTSPLASTTTTTLDLLPPEVPRTYVTSTPPTTAARPVNSTPVGPPIPNSTSAKDPSLAAACGVVASGAGCRVIAYYGNPLSRGMGILGRLEPKEMLASLQQRRDEWAKADPETPTVCALELIVTTVQASPGASGLYRARMSDSVITKVLGWARSAGCQLILDVQVGWSSFATEVPPLAKWLAEPDVHLALDPEWDMPAGVRPGTQIGTTDGSEINDMIDFVDRIVAEKQIRPKMVIVHRFVSSMVTNPGVIRSKPGVRLVVNMDGFGAPARKLSSLRVAIANIATDLHGFKLFTLLDKPMLGPAEVLVIRPAPVFLNYQ